MSKINLMGFSKDRAFQLEAMLRSVRINLPIFDSISLVCKATNPGFKEGYDILKNEYPDVNFIEEKDFQTDTMACFNDMPYTCFFVDDCLVFRKSEASKEEILKTMERACCFSFRMGLNCIHRPENIVRDGNFIWWDWRKAEKNWAYPLSTDFHIFPTGKIRGITEGLAENSHFHINKFEAGWQRFLGRMGDGMASLHQSIAVSLTYNIVRTRTTCAYGQAHPHTTMEMNEWFLEGKRMDFEKMDFSKVDNCHMEIKMEIKKPPARIAGGQKRKLKNMNNL